MALLQPDGFDIFPTAMSGDIAPQRPITRIASKNLAECGARMYQAGAIALICACHWEGNVPAETGGTYDTILYVRNIQGKDRGEVKFEARGTNVRLEVTTRTLADALVDSVIVSTPVGSTGDLSGTLSVPAAADYGVRIRIRAADGITTGALNFIDIFEEDTPP